MRMSTQHVYPLSDIVAHETDGNDCPCGPRIKPVPAENGTMGWLVLHHSLDGRELTEPKVTP